MGSHEIIIDKDVRDWVLVPLLFGIILMKLLQQYAVKARDLGVVGRAPERGWTLLACANVYSAQPQNSFQQ